MTLEHAHGAPIDNLKSLQEIENGLVEGGCKDALENAHQVRVGDGGAAECHGATMKQIRVNIQR